MQFIPLDNYINMLRHAINNRYVSETQLTFLDGTSAYSPDMTGGYAASGIPFVAVAYSNETYTSNTIAKHIRFIASSDTPSKGAYAPTNIIGTTTSSLTLNNKGWTATMNVIGNDGDVINCLYIVQAMQNNNGANKNVMIGALVLDTPVELNASNNYTANFTFAIEF